ncbi:MAG: tripartite tricarboxylate transporter substrate binding protein, partial [Spirochaetales bacterium]|nr:tripartite tricarboxylate transporter substrate binding protein [Spirochaetales bacterium]
MNFRKVLAVLLVAVSILALSGCNGRQVKYPTKAITIVCPWSPGGGTDRTARFVAELLAKELGQPVNVINKTGGDGAVGHSFGANSRPDGYTITNVTFELGSLKYLGYSDITPADYIPVAQFNDNAAAVIVTADSKYNTVPELLDDIKGNAAGSFTFSGASLGSVWDLARIGMLNAYGIDPKSVKFIPTKGAAPSITELLGGHVNVITCSYPEALPQIEAGQLKCLGLMADKRNPDFPDVPTLKEQGLDWTYTTWRGF